MIRGTKKTTEQPWQLAFWPLAKVKTDCKVCMDGGGGEGVKPSTVGQLAHAAQNPGHDK